MKHAAVTAPKPVRGGHDVGVAGGGVVCAADGGLARVVGGGGGGLDLDDGDAEGEEDEGDPFRGAEPLAEEGDGEGGGGEDLHLVGDLEGGDGEVGDGDELERVLDDVEEGGDGELPAVGAEDLAQHLADGGEDGVRGRGVGGVEGGGVLTAGGGGVDAVGGDDEGDGALEELVEEHGGRGRVRLGGRDGDARVVHHYRERGVLHGEGDEAGAGISTRG